MTINSAFTSSAYLRFAALGSGSEGNAMVIESYVNQRYTRILLDCGFSAKELDKRLAVLGLAATDLNAILITHEHHDHAAGAYRVAKRWRLPLYATYGTLATAYDTDSAIDWRQHPYLNVIALDAQFVIGDITLNAIAVPHDAKEPVQYRFESHTRHLAVITDAGHASAHLRQALHGLHALVLECNHDLAMLQRSSYPPSVRQRVGGDWGHLSNMQAATLLADLDTSQLHSLWCAHLSQSNNTPALAQAALAQAIGWDVSQIHVLDQAAPGAWFTV
jgi:phosphoribosyl 1,2-cyclic phosphodiesterase